MKSSIISLDTDYEEIWTNDKEEIHREDGPAIINKITGRGSYYLYGIQVNKKEHSRFVKEKTFPIVSRGKVLYHLNEKGEYHNLYGYAFVNDSLKVKQYFIEGVQYRTFKEFDVARRNVIKHVITFCSKHILTIKKLLYIPELFQNVYYGNKTLIIDLKRKI